MKKFKIISVILVVTIICEDLFGCGINQNKETNNSSDITFTLFINDDIGESDFDDEVAKKIT